MSTALDRIVAYKVDEVTAGKLARSEASLLEQAATQSAPRGFVRYLRGLYSYQLTACGTASLVGGVGWRGQRLWTAIAYLNDVDGSEQLTIKVYSNVTGKPYTSTEEIKELLKRQMLEPVKWEQGTKDLITMGCSQYVEPGPGKQLKAMMRRIDQDAWGKTITLEQ